MGERATDGLSGDGGVPGGGRYGGPEDYGGVRAGGDGEWACRVGGTTGGKICQRDLNGAGETVFGVDGNGDRLADAALRDR